jgi:hypothetical protein
MPKMRVTDMELLTMDFVVMAIAKVKATAQR